MAVNGVTSLGSVPAVGRPIAPLQIQRASGGSTFGPAYVLGGSATQTTNGTYNSLGALLGAFRPRAAANVKPQSVVDRQRQKLLKSAKSKISAGDTAGARADGHKLLARNGRDVTALHVIAHTHLLEKNYREAERFYVRASSLAPDNARLKSDLRAARLLQKDDATVLSAARSRLKNPGTRAEGLRLLGHLSGRRPDDADVYLALADGFAAERSPVRVIGALQEALRNADEQQVGQVISRARALAADHPEAGLPRNLLGRALQKAGRLDDAITELGAAARIAPYTFAYVEDLADAYADRAVERLASGDAANAARDLNAAGAIDPANARVSQASARLAAHRAESDIAGGRYGRALGQLRTAGANAPDDVTFKRKVAALYLRVGGHFEADNDDTQALSAYIQARTLDPSSTAARKHVAELSYSEGLDAVTRKDYSAAIAHLKRARETDRSKSAYRTSLANAYDQRGQIRLATGELDEAIQDFSRGFSLDPSNTSLASNLAAARAQKAG